MDFLFNHVESLVFCSPEPLALVDIKKCLEEMFDTEIEQEKIESAVDFLKEKYNNDSFSFSIYEIAGGYQFLTKPAYQASISILLKQKSKKRLSTSALETLAIIAYKQPITKTEIESIRGVGCDYAVQKLLEKELLEIKGKADSIGRPVLYGTNDKFMENFGINSLQELPDIKDFQPKGEAIGVEND